MPPPSPEATRQAIADAVTDLQRDNYFRSTYGNENLREKQTFIQSFDNFNFKALSDYVAARKRGEDAVLEGLSDSQKAALQKPENEKILIQEIETLTKKNIEKTQVELDKVFKKLSNENFVNRAKPEAVEKEKRIKEELENKIAKFKESMNLYK